MPHPCAVKSRTVVAAVLLDRHDRRLSRREQAQGDDEFVTVHLATEAETVTPEQARAIAKEAYIYGFPMVDSYRVQYSYFVDSAIARSTRATGTRCTASPGSSPRPTPRSRRRTPTPRTRCSAPTCAPSRWC